MKDNRAIKNNILNFTLNCSFGRKFDLKKVEWLNKTIPGQ